MKHLKSLSVSALSRLIVGSIVASGIMVASMSAWAVYRAENTVYLMHEVERRADPTTTAKIELVQALGYGGMIHGFKNYVLRGDEKY